MKNKKAEKLERYYSQFPDGYWKYSLHDAEILSIFELQLPSDYKSKNPKWNCMEISLNSKNAMFDTKVKKILFYNHILTSEISEILELNKPWWISDTFDKTADGKYHISIEIENARGTLEILALDFMLAEVERM